MNNTQQRVEEEEQIINTTTTTSLTSTMPTPYILENSNQTTGTYFVDCSIIIINPSEINNNNNNPHQQQQQQQHSSSQTTSTTTYEWFERKLRSSRKNIQLKGELSRITGKDKCGFDNSSMQDAMFSYPYFLKYKQERNKFYISDTFNHVIRSISNVLMNNIDEWNGELKIEVGQPKQKGYSNGDQGTCELKYPRGFDWDMNDNMYICNETCICKVDGKSNQVSLVAGHATDYGYKDGNNHEARFNVLSGVLCYQLNCQSPLLLYVCDYCNHCIRMIDVTNNKTTTFAGKGKEYGDEYDEEDGDEDGDVDGTLQSARFYYPWDIVKDDENDHILYVSEIGNHKIKMIDMKKGMVSTLVGDANDRSILNNPNQMQIIDPFIYVACRGFEDCIVKIDKHSKQVTKTKFNDGKQVLSAMYGITYHELDQCFYISDEYNIYKLE